MELPPLPGLPPGGFGSPVQQHTDEEQPHGADEDTGNPKLDTGEVEVVADAFALDAASDILMVLGGLHPRLPARPFHHPRD